MDKSVCASYIIIKGLVIQLLQMTLVQPELNTVQDLSEQQH